MKIVRRNPIQKRGSSSRWGTSIAGTLIIFGMGIAALSFKEATVGHTESKESDPEWKKVMVSSLKTPTPTPIPAEVVALKEENRRLDIVSRGAIDRDYILSTSSRYEKMALLECEYIGLDPIVGFAFIHAESRWDIGSVNVNKSRKNVKLSTDYGLMQLNDRGGELNDALGKTLTLSDGRKVKVTRENYKTDVLLNLHIGLSAAKEYLDLTKNVFAAYGMYNGGTGVYENGLKNVVGLNKLGMEDTADFIEEYGFGKAASNIRINFSKSFDKYLKLKTDSKK